MQTKLASIGVLIGLLLALARSDAHGENIVQIMDGTGDGTSVLANPEGIAVDGSSNVYVAGRFSDNVFKITPDGTITEIIDASGDGTNPLNQPEAVAVDDSGNVYVAGRFSDNLFKITPGGAITEIIDATGDGTNPLEQPEAVAVDGAGNVYVGSVLSDNAFKITPGGAITEIIDASGDGFHSLDAVYGIAVDAASNVYVSAIGSDNAFKITPGGIITQIIDSSGDGTSQLVNPEAIAVDGSGNVFVIGGFSNNVFRITPGGVITKIASVSRPRAIAADAAGNAYVGSTFNDRAYKIAPSGTVTQIVDGTGDGTNDLDAAWGIAVDGADQVFVTGETSNNVFKISPRVGHKFSRTSYVGNPPTGRRFVIMMRGRKNGNGQFSLPSEEPTGATAELTVKRDGGILSDALTAGTWSTIGNPDDPIGFKYLNRDAPVGGEVKKLFIKERVIRVVAKGTGTMPVPIGSSGNITTVLTAADRTYCAEAKPPHLREIADRFIRTKDQDPPIACASPSPAFVELHRALLD